MRLSLITEMPVNRHQVLSPQPTIDPRNQSEAFHKSPYYKAKYAGYTPLKNYAGYASPLLIKTVSEKLSRLIKYDINVFVIDPHDPNIQTNFLVNGAFPTGRQKGDLERLATVANVPIAELKNSINFVISGNNNQQQLSAWLYVHQFAEALCAEHNFNEDHEQLYEAFCSLHELIDTSSKWDWKGKLLKFGSAQNNTISDLEAELVTEYLWHGGKIRLNQLPDPAMNTKVVAIFDDIKAIIEQALADSIGLIYYNDTGSDIL